MKLLTNLRRRGLALFMTLTMCLSLLPATAMAYEGEATIEDFLAVIETMGDAYDVESTNRVLDECEAVYARLSPEDQAAMADYYAGIQSYRSDPDEGIETMALLTGEQFSIKVNYGYLDGGSFHLLESKTMVSTCRYGCGHSGYNHTMNASEIVAASGYSGDWRVTRYGYWDSPASTTNCNYNITGSAPYKADQTIWVYGTKPTIEEPEAPGTSTTPGTSGGNGSYFLQVVYVNKAKTEYTFGPRIASSSTARIWYYDNRPTTQIPAGYTLAGWQTSHYHGTNGFLTKGWWQIFGGSEGTRLYVMSGIQASVVLNSGEGVYLIYQATSDPVPDTNTFTLTYDANANDATVNGNKTYVNKVETTDTSYQFNSIEPERDGYKFLGWYTQTTGDSQVTWPKTLTKNNPTATVYAHWEKLPDTHADATIIYQNGGGSGGPTTETVHGSQNYTMKSPTSVGITGPDGKVFSHWAKGDDMYFPGDIFFPTDGSTNTFVAVWKDDDSQTGNATYTVQWFDTDGKSIKSEETRRGALNSPVSVTESDKKVTGYIFNSEDSRNLTSAILLTASGTVLKLYFTKDDTPVVDDGKGISITKTRTAINGDTNKTTATKGDVITWNIVVTNNSNVQKTVNLTEKLTGAKLSQSQVILEPGKSETVTATYTVTGNEGKLFNTVEGTTGQEGPNESPKATDDGTEVEKPDPTINDITITKDASNDAPKVNEQVTYTIKVTNSAEKDAVVTVTDVLPEGLEFVNADNGGTASGKAVTWANVTVAAKGEKTLTVTAKVTMPGEIKNTATVTLGESSKTADKTVNAAGRACIVTFCANGGAWTDTPVQPGTTLADIHKEVTVPYGEKVTRVEDPKLANSKFVGWYEEGSDTPFNFDTPIVKDTKLVAKWTPDIPVDTGKKLSIAKQHTSATNTVSVGTNVMYQIAVRNDTGRACQNVLITDFMPVGLTLTENTVVSIMVMDSDGKKLANIAESAVRQPDQQVTTTLGTFNLMSWTIPELPANTSVNLAYLATVTTTGDFTNYAFVEEAKTASSVSLAMGSGAEVMTRSILSYSMRPTVFSDDSSDNPFGDILKDLYGTDDVPGADATISAGNSGNSETPPVDPVDPVDPVTPVDPITPVTPVTPVDPVDPAPAPGTADPDPAPTGTPATPGTTIADDDVPLAGSVGLNDMDHFAYVIGYEDDTVRPLNNITRAEAATIFFRLMTDEYREEHWSTTNSFSDVNAGDWYNNAISTCANAGVLKGYDDGTFRPNEPITRAEFATMAAGFMDASITDDGVGDFSDTANHWAASAIRRAAKAGWVTGSGNKFNPDTNISRAEVMTIVNRMLDRTPDKDHMLPTMKKWTDNPEDAWYYEAVQEATNEHDYERDELSVETWTELLTVRDWAALEKEWANNGGASAPKADDTSVDQPASRMPDGI